MTDVNMYTVTIMKQWIMVKPESMIQLYKKIRGRELSVILKFFKNQEIEGRAHSLGI